MSEHTTAELDLDAIRTDGGTQLRAEVNPDAVKAYADAYRAGEALPRPLVFHDGVSYWPGDGHTRIEAARAAGLTSLSCEVRRGTARDAVLYAAGANAAHGIRRTRADTRNAIETLLRDPEWGCWSDHEIARRCLVSHTTVGRIRARLSSAIDQGGASLVGLKIEVKRTVTRNGKTYQQDVSRIGKAPAAAKVIDNLKSITTVILPDAERQARPLAREKSVTTVTLPDPEPSPVRWDWTGRITQDWRAPDFDEPRNVQSEDEPLYPPGTPLPASLCPAA